MFRIVLNQQLQSRCRSKGNAVIPNAIREAIVKHIFAFF